MKIFKYFSFPASNKRIESNRIRIETVTVTSLNSGCISIKEENPIKQGLKLSDNILLCFLCYL